MFWHFLAYPFKYCSQQLGLKWALVCPDYHLCKNFVPLQAILTVIIKKIHHLIKAEISKTVFVILSAFVDVEDL